MRFIAPPSAPRDLCCLVSQPSDCISAAPVLPCEARPLVTFHEMGSWGFSLGQEW